MKTNELQKLAVIRLTTISAFMAVLLTACKNSQGTKDRIVPETIRVI